MEHQHESFPHLDKRADALQAAVTEAGLLPDGFIEEFTTMASEHWVSDNGAQVVARAWSDPDFKARLLQDGRAAVAELGFGMPEHHRSLVVLENTPSVHNVICCSMCSCTAFTIIGLPPDWYKDLDYRARAVRESRTVLAEMGLTLPDDVEIRVWDTTADTRYMVLPIQPESTMGWDESRLRKVVSQDCMIGTARLEPPYAASFA